MASPLVEALMANARAGRRVYGDPVVNQALGVKLGGLGMPPPAPAPPPQAAAAPGPATKRLSPDEERKMALWQALMMHVDPRPLQYPEMPLDRADPSYVPMQSRVSNLPKQYRDLIQQSNPEAQGGGWDYHALPTPEQEMLTQMMLASARDRAQKMAEEEAQARAAASAKPPAP